MQKLCWLFCVINFIFHQSIISDDLLTIIGHDYPVPVDKYDSDENFTSPPDPLGGVKGQIFKFCNNIFC